MINPQFKHESSRSVSELFGSAGILGVSQRMMLANSYVLNGFVRQGVSPKGDAVIATMPMVCKKHHVVARNKGRFPAKHLGARRNMDDFTKRLQHALDEQGAL